MMKFVLMFFIAMVLVFQWKTWRKSKDIKTDSKPKSPLKSQEQPQTIVACKHCGVHLPATDVVHGNAGSYCCVAHRQKQES